MCECQAVGIGCRQGQSAMGPGMPVPWCQCEGVPGSGRRARQWRPHPWSSSEMLLCLTLSCVGTAGLHMPSGVPGSQPSVWPCSADWPLTAPGEASQAPHSPWEALLDHTRSSLRTLGDHTTVACTLPVLKPYTRRPFSGAGAWGVCTLGQC